MQVQSQLAERKCNSARAITSCSYMNPAHAALTNSATKNPVPYFQVALCQPRPLCRVVPTVGFTALDTVARLLFKRISWRLVRAVQRRVRRYIRLQPIQLCNGQYGTIIYEQRQRSYPVRVIERVSYFHYVKGSRAADTSAIYIRSCPILST
jgi:hypothetical protein